MPDYEYKLKNGKTMTLSGNTPPSDADAEAEAKAAGVELLPVDSAPEAPPKSTAPDPVQLAKDTLADIEKKKTTTPPTDTETKPTSQQPPNPNSDEGLLHKMWRKGTEPITDIPSRAASVIADPITNWGENHPGMLGAAARYGGAFTQATGDAVSGMINPLNIAAAVATGGASLLADAAPGVAGALSGIAKATAVPVAGEGVYHTFRPGASFPERIAGTIEMAGASHALTSGLGERPPTIPDAETTTLPEQGLAQPKPKLAPEVEAAKPVGSTATPAAAEVNAEQAAKAPITPKDTKLPPKQKYKLDNESGTFIPVDEAGNQTGPARGLNGEEIKPEFVKAGKYATKEEPSNLAQQIYDIPRGMMSADPPFITSAAFRQAAPLIGTKAWLGAWGKAAQAFGSQTAAEAINDAIHARPLFKGTVFEGKPIKSFAEQAGVALSDFKNWTSREEQLKGELAEKIPLLGRYFRASNRAYGAFLNSVRADTFESLFYDAKKLGTWDTMKSKLGFEVPSRNPVDPTESLALGKQIAEFVNTATGRGSLSVEAPFGKLNMEGQAKLLTNIFFSPRKIASEIRMLNPTTYAMTDPFVRRQYLTAVVRRVGAWWTIAGLAQLAGASVSKDPTNPDFGKIKIGNTRIDPPGGLQQFLVLGAQIAGGGKTSSTTPDPYNPSQGQFKPFGKGYKPETAASTALNFATNRLHPTAKMAWDLFNATEKDQFHVGDELLQRVLPMYSGDLVTVGNDNKELAPMIFSKLGAGFVGGAGMGMQTYDKGTYGQPTFIPADKDLNVYMSREWMKQMKDKMIGR